MNEALNDGAIAIKNSLMRAHEFFAENKEFIEFQIVNVTHLHHAEYLDRIPSLCVTLRSNPARHCVIVRDGYRYYKEARLNPYLPSIYFCIYMGLENRNCAVSEAKTEYRTRLTANIGLHPLLVDTKGEILEPFWPTYDTRYGIHTCGVRFDYPHGLVGKFLVQQDFFKEYIPNVWNAFWDSTFTYAEVSVSREAGKVARVLETVGQHPLYKRSNEFYVYDVAGILAAAEHHKIPWSKYPKMRARDRDYLTSLKTGAGLDFKLNTRATRYKEVKKQIENLVL